MNVVARITISFTHLQTLNRLWMAQWGLHSNIRVKNVQPAPECMFQNLCGLRLVCTWNYRGWLQYFTDGADKLSNYYFQNKCVQNLNFKYLIDQCKIVRRFNHDPDLHKTQPLFKSSNPWTSGSHWFMD